MSSVSLVSITFGNTSLPSAPAGTGAALLQQLVESAGIILNPLPLPRVDAPPMDSLSNPLLNSATQLPLQTLTPLPQELLGNPQVIQALVLRATLLPPPPGTEPAPQQPSPQTPQQLLPLQPSAPASQAAATQAAAAIAAPQYRITLQWQGRLLQLLSTQPPREGSRVQVQVGARGELTLLATAAPARPAAAAPVAPPLQSSPAAPTPAPAAAAAVTLQQALRENLPRQTPLNTLVPVLQKLAAPALREQLPAPLARAVAHLLQVLPKPQQLQRADTVKQALRNSGTLLEARVARAAAQPATAAEAVPRVLAADVKAQIGQLLGLLVKLGFAAPEPARAAVPAAPAEADQLYNPRPTPPQHHNAAGPAPNRTDDAATALHQLGKLLQSALARIQVNQLDSAASRHPAADAPPPVPTWVFELPLQTSRGADNLQIRLEQHRRRREGAQRVQWNVQLAFDLHELGKLAATLTILDRAVSATLWSEREHTHHAVQREIDTLRSGLEAVGVKVSEVQCRLGLPPARSAPLTQQLVDVRT